MLESNIETKRINDLIDEEISRYWNTEPQNANSNQIYRALCIVIRDMLLKKRNNFLKQESKSNQKRVYYMCMEFLTERHTRRPIWNRKRPWSWKWWSWKTCSMFYGLTCNTKLSCSWFFNKI